MVHELNKAHAERPVLRGADMEMFDLQCSIHLIEVLHAALSEGDVAKGVFSDALFSAWLNLDRAYKALEQVLSEPP